MLVTCQLVTTVVHLIQHLQLMVVLYTIFTHNDYKKAIRIFSNRFYFIAKCLYFLELLLDGKMSRLRLNLFSLVKLL